MKTTPILCDCAAAERSGQHSAILYTEAESLIAALLDFAGGAIERGDAAIIIATQRHIDLFIQRLKSESHHDVKTLVDSGQLVCINARPIADQITSSGDRPNLGPIRSMMDDLIAQVMSRYGQVAIYGETVNLLWQQGRVDAVMEVEAYWNELTDRHGFDVLCGYLINVLDTNESVQAGIRSICTAHTHVTTGMMEDRLDCALDAALQQVLPDADIAGLRRALAERQQPDACVPNAQAVLMGLHDVLPSLAQDVCMLARDHYQRGQTRSGIS